MDNKTFINKLTEIKACSEAIDFVRNNKFTLKQAWNKCERADWMLWLMYKMEFATRRERIHIICDCAATALKYVPKGEERPKKAIEATRKYADEPTEVNRAAWDAARDAAWDAARDAAWDAAWAAAWAAARAAAWAAAWAAARAAAWAAAWDAARDAAWDAARDAAWAAARDAAWDAAHKKMCKIIRKKIKI